MLLKCGTILDCTGNEPKENLYILIENGIIKDILNAKPDGYEGETADFSDGFVMPGMINCHTHICLLPDADPDAIISKSTPEATLIAADNARKYLYSGVTTIRDLGGMSWIDLAVRDAVNSGISEGPDIIASGQFLTMTGGHGHNMGIECDGTDECRKAARLQLKKGADMVKIMATGGVLTKGVEPGQAQLNRDEIEAAVYEAHKCGKRTAAHAQGATGIKNAVLAGIDSIEHGFYMDDECIRLMLERGVFFVPTLSPPHFIYENKDGMDPEFVRKIEDSAQSHKNALKNAIKAGVKIAAGTDGGTPFNLHSYTYKEIELLSLNGLDNHMAVLAATRDAAQCIGLDDRGTLEKGKRADVIVLDANPLSDITALARVRGIFKEGVRIKLH